MRIPRHAVGALLAMVLAWGLSAVPAEATVHEIVAQWCSGQGELAPPGISQENSNFARPLNAVGVVRQVPVSGPSGPFILVTFDFDHPAVKVQSSGVLIQIGVTPDGIPIMLDVPEPDPNFPAFQHCPRLASL